MRVPDYVRARLRELTASSLKSRPYGLFSNFSSYFIARPSRANAGLYVCDHDLHHSAVRCNYGKRLSLWDKAFGTYHRSWGTAAHGEAPAKATRAR